MAEPARKSICKNRKAHFLYSIDETIEAGLVLTGSEVKSLRAGKGSLIDAYAKVSEGELWLHGANITPYSHARYEESDATRTRKLLAHKKEIKRLIGKVKEKGFSLIPLSIYFKEGRAKMELALAKGKRQYDKREDIKRREQEREMAKAMKRPLKE